MASINELCELYGSDKCPKIGHSYAPFYDEIFADKKNAKAILELGVGSKEVMGNYISNYITGSSLYVWRDYFKKAEIYGLDDRLDCDIKEERMHIVIGDQSKEEDLQKLVDMAKEFDIIIDDCSHDIEDQIFSAQYLLPHLKVGGIYCIEDVYNPDINFPRFKESFDEYKVETHEFTKDRNDCLVVIRK